MEVTDRTLEQVITDLLDSNDTRLIVIACILVGLVIGVLVTILYYSKIRYYSLEKELADSKAALKQVENERNEYKEKYERERTRAECGRNLEYALLARNSDQIP